MSDSAETTVRLSVLKGPSAGSELTFTERAVRVAGRASDCLPRISRQDTQVSWHHCLFDINPPDIRVRDLGSAHGTQVNGEDIGRPAVPGGPAGTVLPERDLIHGDEVRLGGTLLRIDIPARGTGLVRRASPPRCAHCGGDADPGGRDGAVVCGSCRAGHGILVKTLLSRAAGDEALAELRHYEMISEPARGAACLARHRDTGALVTLKVLAAKVPVHERARSRFLREMAAVRRLRHPHIAGLSGIGAYGAVFCVAQEYREDGTLRELLDARGGVLPADEAVAITVRVLDGLAHAHAHAARPAVPVADVHGPVHGDISPSTVLVSGHSTAPSVRIGDFGLTAALDRAGLSGLTRTGSMARDAVRLPRTQIVDQAHTGPEVDVWAAAATLYHMLTGTFPRTVPPSADPFVVLLREPPVPVRQRMPSVPHRLARVVDAALIDSPRIVTSHAAGLSGALRDAMR